jgi:hypothetical protein
MADGIKTKAARDAGFYQLDDARNRGLGIVSLGCPSNYLSPFDHVQKSNPEQPGSYSILVPGRGMSHILLK